MSKKDEILKGALVAISLLALGALIVLVASCGAEEPAVDPLAGTEWQVRSYAAGAGGMASPLAGTQLTASWADGQVAGSAGCNSYTATYTLEDDTLTIGPVVSTKMACEQPVMDQETAFLNDLSSASSFTISSSALQILNGDGQVVIDLVPYTPVPAETSVPAETTPEPGAVDDSWDRVQAKGSLVVGTSPDYPPFESYVGENMIDGFDIALMDEIGRRLGVRIDWIPYAFDGLGPALYNGEIDVAIAAISKTPEREVYADFSNVYLVGEGAALALEDAGIVLTKVDDITKYKIGVQRNTVYLDRIQTQYVDTQMMPEANLFKYEKPEDAIHDLREGRLELVVMDSQPALAFTEEGGLKIVGTAVNHQDYAIALPKGAAALKAKIDEQITALFADNTIAVLSEKYLGDPRVLPTPTPAPTSQPGPTPTCVNGLTLVKHLTQEKPMQPGASFEKGWQVQNTGSCPWTTSYRLVFVAGKQMGGETLAVTRQVKPGETYDLKLKLVAPLNPGNYDADWQMVDAKGKGFGQLLRVSVQVLSAPTATPNPTQTPSPSIQFTVDKDHIKTGESVVFSWDVQNVDKVYFYSQYENWEDHGVAGKAKETEWPTAPTTTYYLKVLFKGGRPPETQQRVIYVEAQPPAAPKIVFWDVSPSPTIVLGQVVNVKWKVEGKDISVRVFVKETNQTLHSAVEGVVPNTPGTTGRTTYAVEATGAGGRDYREWGIDVVPPTDPVTPEPPPPDPVINKFEATPPQLTAGDWVKLTWSVGGGTQWIVIKLNGQEVHRDERSQGDVSYQLSQTGEYNYELFANNIAKEVASGPRIVVVSAAPPQNPLLNTHWKVTSIQDGATPVFADTPPTLNFYESGSFDGQGACTYYGGNYRADGDAIAITVMGTSPMDCTMYPDADARAAQDNSFLELLPMATNFSLDGGQLLVLDPGGMRLFEAIPY